MSTTPWKPSPAQIRAAHNGKVPDVLAPHLQVLFCGINPSVYSAAVGHHFARPGNRFWPALHAAGFTDQLLSPFEDQELLERHGGLTNLVARATVGAAELNKEELRTGARRLQRKVRRCKPRVVAFLGITAYRAAFDRRRAELGRQEERLADSLIWVLPNPSGLNAHFTPAGLAELFAELRQFTLS